MSASPSPRPPSAIVTRLRRAGCVFAEEEAQLLVAESTTQADLSVMVDRRAAGLPLEYVLGWAEFCGLRMAVEPGVFVPRRRTEFLVHQAADLIRQTAAPGRALPRPPVIVDLCCGTGALGAALAAELASDLASELGQVELHAADVDAAAVRCARRNIAAADGQAHVGDLFDALPATLRGRVDILVANVPYVPTEEIGLLPPEARDYEPQAALDGGADGLDVQRRVTAAAPLWLAPGGQLLVETSARQAPQAVDTVARSGLLPRVVSSDELDATVVIASTQ